MSGENEEVHLRSNSSPVRTASRALIPTACVLMAALVLGSSPGASERTQGSNDELPASGRIVFTGNSPLYTIRPDGSGRKQVPVPASVPRPYYGPTWSPDGKRIAFSAWSSETGDDIYVYNTKTGTAKAVVTGPSEDDQPDWSPEGDRLVYVSDKTGDSELHTINLRTGRKRRLTNTSLPEENPQWGPGGRYVAFTRCRPAPDEDAGRLCRIALFNLRKDRFRFLTPKQERFSDGDAAWSPRGRWIAFVRWRLNGPSAGPQLWKMRSNGSNFKQLTSRRGYYPYGPSWSPNGQRIVFEMSVYLGDMEYDYSLRTIRPDGSKNRRLTSWGEPEELGPDWQPVPR